MINCPKCGSSIKEGEKICKVCGTEIVNFIPNSGGNNPMSDSAMQAPMAPMVDSPMQAPTAPMSDSPMQAPMAPMVDSPMQAPTAPMVDSAMQAPTAPMVDSPQAPMAPMAQPQVNSMAQPQVNSMAQPQVNSTVQSQTNLMVSNDVQLIDAYIGKNAENIKKGGFSGYSFFFGLYYVLYRKMWYLGTIIFVINIIVNNFLPSFSYLITLTMNIFISIKFKSIYLKNVKEQVNKIKSANPNASQNELLNICREKGGTTVIPIIIIFALFIIGAIALAFLNGVD